MVLASASALDGGRTSIEYRVTGMVPERLTPQRAQALERLQGRQGLVRELATAAEVSDSVIRGLVKAGAIRSEEHTSELQSLMRISYAVFCLKKKKIKKQSK